MRPEQDFIFEQRLWNAVPDFTDLGSRAKKATGFITSRCYLFDLDLGWVGWDGNPNVHPITTERRGMARWICADLYWKEVDALRTELPCTLAHKNETLLGMYEPYRAILRDVRDTLAHTRDRLLLQWEEKNLHERIYTKQAAPRASRDLLSFINGNRWECIAQGRQQIYSRRISALGLCCCLDIRQESDKHTDAMNAITQYLGLGSYKEWRRK